MFGSEDSGKMVLEVIREWEADKKGINTKIEVNLKDSCTTKQVNETIHTLVDALASVMGRSLDGAAAKHLLENDAFWLTLLSSLHDSVAQSAGKGELARSFSNYAQRQPVDSVRNAKLPAGVRCKGSVIVSELEGDTGSGIALNLESAPSSDAEKLTLMASGFCALVKKVLDIENIDSVHWRSVLRALEQQMDLLCNSEVAREFFCSSSDVAETIEKGFKIINKTEKNSEGFCTVVQFPGDGKVH